MPNEGMSAMKVGLQLDSAQFTQSLSEITRRLKGVKSEFDATSDGTKEFANSTDGLKAKSEMLNRQMSLQEAQLKELKRQYDHSKKTVGENAKATELLLIAYNKARGGMNKTEAQIKKVGDALDDANDKTKKASDGLVKYGDKAKDIGGALTGTTAAILGVSAGLMKVADDADATTGRIQAVFGSTKEEAEKLSGVARDVWKQGFGEGMEEVEEGLIAVKQNFKDLNEVDLEQITKDTLTLASVMDSDVNEVTRAGSNLMEGFGIESAKAFDLMAWGGQNGLNFSQEMFDNLAEYSPLYKDMGFSAEDYFQLLEQGSESGVYNLDYINDAMKEFQIRTKDGSKATSEAMGEMSDSTQDVFTKFNNGKATVKELHNAVIKDLKGMEDQQEANAIGVSLYGTKWEDLEADSMYAMGNIDGGIKNVDGAMARSGENIEKTFGEKLQMAWRKAQDDLIPLGEKLLVVAEDILPKITSAVSDMTDWWVNLSPEMQKLIGVIGGVSAIAAPAIFAFGAIASSVGAIIPVMTYVATSLGITGGAVGLLSAGFGLLVSPVGLAVGALALLGAGAVLLDKELDKPVIKSKVFSDAVSTSTQEAVGSYLALEKDATSALQGLIFSQETMTQEMADSLVAKYKTMGERILDAMDKTHQDQKQKTIDLFAENDTLAQTEEDRILAGLETDYQKKQEKLAGYQKSIKDITDKAAKEKRKTTYEEEAKIAMITQEMNGLAVKEMSKSSKEQQAILSGLKSQSKIITTETAVETVKNSKDAKNGVIKEADELKKKNIAQIEYMRDVTGSITATKAKVMIENEEKTRKETVAKADDMHKKVVKSAKKQAGEHADEVDWEAGRVKSGWDVMTENVGDAVKWFNGLFGKGDTSSYKPKKSKSNPYNYSRRDYANGTPQGTHPGGMALVGEEGMELAHLPGQGVTMLGVGGQHLANLPKGTSVLPARHTENVMKQYGIPQYAGGVGNFFDVISGGASAVWNKMTNDFGISDGLIPNWSNELTGSPVAGIGNILTSGIKGVIDGFIGSFGGGGSGFGGAFRKTSSFGYRTHPITGRRALHNGDDYGAPYGTPIPAQFGGQVTQAGYHNLRGNYVRVNSGNGLEQIYQHNSRNLVGVGSMVKAGQIVGTVGSTGASTGAHLHYEVIKNGTPVAPSGYAKGGFINNEHVATVGEDGKREVVIPLEQHQARARELWTQAGMELGMLNIPKPNQTSPNSKGANGIGSTSYEIANTYEIKVEATINNDMDVEKLAEKIQKSIERQQNEASRALGVI